MKNSNFELSIVKLLIVELSILKPSFIKIPFIKTTGKTFFHQIVLIAFGVSMTVCASAQESAQQPTTYSAQYKARANHFNASASRSLTLLEDGSYALVNDLEATLLGQTIARLQQRSEFHYVADKIVTDLYIYELSGISSDDRRMAFDWQAGTVESSEDDEAWTLELQDQAFDPLSHQLELRQQLRLMSSSQSEPEITTEFEFAVVDGDEIEQLRYQFVGEEVLETPLGNLNSLKFERIRAPTSSRSTVIWLARDWEFLIARIEQVNGSGMHITLELEEAELNGASVTALP